MKHYILRFPPTIFNYSRVSFFSLLLKICQTLKHASHKFYMVSYLSIIQMCNIDTQRLSDNIKYDSYILFFILFQVPVLNESTLLTLLNVTKATQIINHIINKYIYIYLTVCVCVCVCVKVTSQQATLQQLTTYQSQLNVINKRQWI